MAFSAAPRVVPVVCSCQSAMRTWLVNCIRSHLHALLDRSAGQVVSVELCRDADLPDPDIKANMTRTFAPDLTVPLSRRCPARAFSILCHMHMHGAAGRLRSRHRAEDAVTRGHSPWYTRMGTCGGAEADARLGLA